MKNGDKYYMSDNGRIRRKIRYSNVHVDIDCYTDQAQRYNSNREHYGSHLHYDGAKPKQTQHYSQSVSHGNRNTEYVTTRDSTPPSGHPRYESTYRRQDVYTPSNNVRTYSDSHNYDQHRVRMVNHHTNYRNYTQQYMDRFINKHHNQRLNNAISSTYASKQKKNNYVYQPSDYLYIYTYIVLTYYAIYIIITIDKSLSFMLWCSVLDFMLYEIIHVCSIFFLSCYIFSTMFLLSICSSG